MGGRGRGREWGARPLRREQQGARCVATSWGDPTCPAPMLLAASQAKASSRANPRPAHDLTGKDVPPHTCAHLHSHTHTHTPGQALVDAEVLKVQQHGLAGGAARAVGAGHGAGAPVAAGGAGRVGGWAALVRWA